MADAGENPIRRFIERQGFIVLDGGLATTLEARGLDLNDALWSSGVLLERPDSIRRVHREFLDAGADCVTTASYQASLPGFAGRGLDAEAGAALMLSSVDLAVEAREAFLADASHADASHADTRLRPLVAASVGPYGAFLADGSEYTGRYDLDGAGLRAFHRDRWRILADSAADLIACETIPSLAETAVLLSLLADTPERWAWFSFSCRDETRLNDGNRLVEAVRPCDDAPNIAAVGVNCTDPRYVPSLIREMRRATAKPLIVYPNLGETYDAAAKVWRPGTRTVSWGESVRAWYEAGARGIGGCCRVGPREIRLTRRILSGQEGS